MQAAIEQDFRRIQHKKTAIDAYNKTIDIFREQCSTLEEHMNKSNRDEERLSENFRRLQIRLQDIAEQRKRLQRELDEDIKCNRERDPQLSRLKHKIQEIKQDQEECMKKLLMYEHQVPESELRRRYLHTDNTEEEINFIDEKELIYKFPDHAVKENWFFNDFGRAEADKLLAGQADGTFLIRPSTSAAYACSLICKKKVHHCLIKKTEEGYGFAEPFNLHLSLTDLVLHYAANSLLPHNDNLDTKLNIPARLTFRNR